MSWIQMLYNTYENCIKNKEFFSKEPRLLPCNHIAQQSHVEVVISGDGDFRRASAVKKQIILPATERSASRGSGAAPHGLADKIQYCAKDYVKFDLNGKSYFDSYISQLEDWVNSDFSKAEIIAVYRYLIKGELIKDLVENKILWLDENNKLLKKWTNKKMQPDIFKLLPKKPEQNQGDVLVRWVVEISGVRSSITWEDESIFQSWIDFYNQAQIKKGICFVTGDMAIVAKHHPSKIRSSADKAKIISSNDNENYTFRGRFDNANQACEIGSEVTQKAHNALSWLVARQGYKNKDEIIVSWASTGKKIPDIFSDSRSLFNQEISLNDLALIDNREDELEGAIISRDIGQVFAHNLNKLMAGYRASLPPAESIMILGLEAATPGRMAITYYQQLQGSDFLERLEQWCENFAWELPVNTAIDSDKKNKFKRIWQVGTPSLKEIALAAFGNNDDKLQKSTVKRLLPCVIEIRQIPFDLVRAIMQRLLSCSKLRSWEWEKNLGIFCAVFRGYYLRYFDVNQKREYKMTLDTNLNSRNYLFGRLLALAEHIEEKALFIAGESHRQTTAAKLMQRFADRPASTWKIIEISLMPYKTRLAAKWPGYLEKLKNHIDEIFCLFLPEDFQKQSALDGEFLLGYHCQRQALKNRFDPEKI